jgi:hypothetical protein
MWLAGLLGGVRGRVMVSLVQVIGSKNELVGNPFPLPTIDPGSRFPHERRLFNEGC